MKYIIQGETISKKNSKQIFINKRTGKRFITTSKAYKNWYDSAIKQFLFEYPDIQTYHKRVNVYMTFYRKTKRSFDYNNISQGIMDLLVDIGLLEDDDDKHAVPVFDPNVYIDKDNPRCEITIEEIV